MESNVNHIEPVTALTVTGTLLQKIEPLRKAVEKLKNFAGSIPVGGVSQKRFLARRDSIYKIFEGAGYTGANSQGISFSVIHKIKAADIPNNLNNRTYEREFKRLQDYTADRLNRSNPTLGDYWRAQFPFVMANGGNIYSEPITALGYLVAAFPPGKYPPNSLQVKPVNVEQTNRPEITAEDIKTDISAVTAQAGLLPNLSRNTLWIIAVVIILSIVVYKNR